MRGHYVLTVGAELQVNEIVAYIARESTDASTKVNAELFKAFELLARHPGLGHTRSELTRQPLKFWNVHPYLVAYDPATAPLEIVAVFRGVRDAREWFG